VTDTAAPAPPEGRSAPRAGLARRPDGSPAPTAWERARGRLPAGPDPLAWLGAVLVALLALVLRLWRIGEPRAFAFDETYYAKDAWSLLRFGYARDYLDTADEAILAGETTTQWADDPSMVVHPEVGKWLIAAGEWAFGMDPAGWRIPSAIAGALTVLVVCRLGRRLTGSTLLGCTAGLLLALDGLHLVLSRLALLDVFLVLFLVLAAACLVLDRDRTRARMARLQPGPVGPGGWGPVRGVLVRPWLLAGGVCFGLAVGTKWTALFPLAAFGLLVWAWSAGARRSFGVRRAWLRSALVDGVPAFVQLVVLNAEAYEQELSATQYTQFAGVDRSVEGVDEDGCLDGELQAVRDEDRRWPTATEPDADGLGEVAQSLRSLWSYQRDVYTFHTEFLVCSEHSYQSSPRGWLLLNRPVGVAAENDIPPGRDGCEAAADSSCLRQVLLLGTPVLWWAGAAALLWAVVRWAATRDWRLGFVLVGAASTWLPWLRYDDRPIFLFYAAATLPFTVLALTVALGRIVGPDRTPTRRRTLGVVAAGSFVLLVVLNFAWFWPVWTDGLLTRQEWLDRIWFARWV